MFYIRFDAFKAMKNHTVLLKDVTSCSLVGDYQRSRRIHYGYRQGKYYM
jgi:hypothetical protein